MLQSKQAILKSYNKKYIELAAKLWFYEENWAIAPSKYSRDIYLLNKILNSTLLSNLKAFGTEILGFTESDHERISNECSSAVVNYLKRFEKNKAA